MRTGKLKKISMGLGVFLFLISCLLPGVATTPIQSQPSLSPSDIGTLVALTAGAAQVQTASALPTITATSTVTRIPSVTFSPTPTFIYILMTDTLIPTETSVSSIGNVQLYGTATPDERLTGRPWTCLVTGSTPPRNVSQKPGTDFYITWRVMNTGTKTWSNNGIDFLYESGYRAEQRQLQDLPLSVVTGGSINLKVLLTAPKAPGTYSTIWKLKVGQTTFCRMQITFLVE